MIENYRLLNEEDQKILLELSQKLMLGRQYIGSDLDDETPEERSERFAAFAGDLMEMAACGLPVE